MKWEPESLDKYVISNQTTTHIDMKHANKIHS